MTTAAERAGYTAPRPVRHPQWAAFARWVGTPGSGVNPKLAFSDREFGIHGWLIFTAFLAGHDDGKYEALTAAFPY